MQNQSAAAETAPRVLEQYVDPSAGTSLLGVLRGGRYLLGGALFFGRDPKLRRMSLVPTLVNLLLFVVALVVGFSHFSTILTLLVPRSGAWWVVVKVLVGVLLVPLLVLLSLLATMIVGSIVNGEVYSMISARAEALILGRSLSTQGGALELVREIGREILLQLGLLTIYLAGALVLLLLGVIPLIGPLLSAACGLLWTWYLLAFEFLSPSLSRHGLSAPAQWLALLRPRAAYLGFGALAWLILLALVTTPWAIVGGTRMYLALAAHEHLPSLLSADDRAALRRTS